MKKCAMRYIVLIIVMSAMLVAFPLVSWAEEVPISDPSPAIYVYKKTANSVVGIITQEQTWVPEYSCIQEITVSTGSGVVLRDGGYILTNSHVVDCGSIFNILMPDGKKVDAELVGTDSFTDIAVLKITDKDAASQLTPVEIGTSTELLVGSTVIAIGNPGGENLANTVTQGVVSALERKNVSANITTYDEIAYLQPEIAYIQHDAAINSGNSGGGLFNYKGQLIGINTLKYFGSEADSVTFEGLGFAIPAETVINISSDLIEYGKVKRAALAITVSEYLNGPTEPMDNIAPSGMYVMRVFETATTYYKGYDNVYSYDYIYSINGERIHSYTQMTALLNRYEAGDIITVELLRYAHVVPMGGNANNGYYFGEKSSDQTPTLTVSGGYETIMAEVELVYLEE